MKTIRLFFDQDKKEVEAKDAVSCHEVVLDDDGKFVSDAWYFVQPKGEQK